MGKFVTVPRILAFLTGLVLIWPVLVTGMPPLVDYPNHVVRFWLLSGGADHPPLSTFFQVDWSHTATNIVMDALAVTLRVVFSAPITGRIVLITAALLPAAGLVLVSRQIYGKLTWWHILLCLNTWGLLLLTGLMSYQMSLGAALIALWLDLVYAEQKWMWRWPRQVVQGLVVLLVHPFGAAFYIVLITGICVGRDARILLQPKAWFRLMTRLLEAWLPLLVAGGLIVLRIVVSQIAPEESGPIPVFWEDGVMSFAHVLMGFVTPWRTYNLPVDLIFLGLFWLPVAVSFSQKRLTWHGGLLTAGIILFGLSLLCPQEMGSTSLVDVRLSTMAVMILSLAVNPEISLGPQRVFRKHTTLILCTLALGIVTARSAWLTGVWHIRQADIQSLYRAMDYIPEGARVVPLTVKVDDEDLEPLGRYLGDMTTTFGHIPTLAVLRRHAYVPTVFAESGKQPLSVRDPYVDHHEISGGLLGTLEDLKAGNGEVAGYLPYWKTEFDYVLIVNADMNPADNRIDQGACLVTDQGYAKLYHVQNAPCKK